MAHVLNSDIYKATCVFDRYCPLSTNKLDLVSKEVEKGVSDHVTKLRNQKRKREVNLHNTLLNDPKSLSDRQVCQFCGFEGLVMDVQKHEKYCSQGVKRPVRIQGPPHSSKSETKARRKFKTHDHGPSCPDSSGFVPASEEKIAIKPNWQYFCINEAKSQAMCLKCCTVFHINIKEPGIFQMTGNMGIHVKNGCSKAKPQEKRKLKTREEMLEWKKKCRGKMYNNPVSKCPDCVVMVPSSQRKSHQAEHHSPNIPEECDECSYRALTKTAIKCHKMKWHSDHLKILSCPLGCSKKFANKTLLDYHLRRSCQLSKQADKYKEEHKTKNSLRKRKTNIRRHEMYKNLGISSRNSRVVKRMSCKRCEGCLAPDCELCRYCLNPEWNKKCLKRVCWQPKTLDIHGWPASYINEDQILT